MRAILRNRVFQAGASLLIGTFFMWRAIARTPMDDVWRTLGHVDLLWLLVALAMYWVALTLRSWRWRIILAPVRRMKFSQVYCGLLVGYAANYVLPARLGELVRADFLGRRYGVSRMSVIGTIVVERLFDVIVFIGFILAGLWTLHLRQDSRIEPVLHAVELVSVGCVLLGVTLVILLQMKHRALPKPLAFLETQLRSLTEGLHLITGAPEAAVLTAATAIVWTADSIATWLLCRSLSIQLNFFQLLLVMGMSCLAALIPSAPANLGALQYALVLAFELLALPGPNGFSLALLTQGCFVVSCILVGGALYVRATLNPIAKIAPN